MADLQLLEKLCRAQGASGREDEVRALILAEISPLADEVSVDPMGNILVFKKGKQRAQKKVMLDAHMDEVAMTVTSVTEEGLLTYVNCGGIDARVQCGVAVQVGGAKLPGVIGIKPVHLCKKEEQETAPDEDSLYIDIGARDKEDALRHVSSGDTACFAPYFEVIGTRAAGKALDNRAGCAVLIELLRQTPDYDLYFTFTVQEEIGLRGAKTAAYTVNPDAAITVETTTAADIAGVKPDKQICALDDGAVLSFMDKRTVYDRAYYDEALARAEALSIKAQPKRGVVGGNNAGAIHTSRGGVRTLAISLPCRYLHAPVGVISLDDYDAVLRLVSACAADMASEIYSQFT